MPGPEDVEEVELQEAERINRVDDADFLGENAVIVRILFR